MTIELQINGKLHVGRVERYMHEALERDGALHFTLLDPEHRDENKLKAIIEAAERAGTDAYMVGGSLGVVQSATTQLMKLLKKMSKKPVIVFPGNVDAVTELADAIFFMSLLNSRNSYWISGAQAIGAPVVRAFGIEPIPMAYIIMEPGGTVSFIGDAKPIPNDKPDIAAAYALAGQYMGMRVVYLEAGSGAKKPVDVRVVATVRRAVDVPVIVGGGIRSAGDAKKRVEAGADVIVTGTLVEDEKDVYKALSAVVHAVKEGGKKRLKKKA
ncbi:MAG: geranylgeranylglyceryl/heptaprenylglyceryl phosphate synthase [Candidatus Aenigmarchaeota archaeon]|nr:geranylgeranylglyceryl/heptaprenylglyceryl phosphate synthase [Candidatus Aenigmarchaeota archaeon]